MPDDDLEDLDAVVRRGDPDRWLATRFIADRQARADVTALYAFDHELTRARRVASNALVAEMRLTWWREAVDEVWSGGRVRAHPVAQALAAMRARHDLPRGPLEAMIDARIDALERASLDLGQALAWADAAQGSAALLATMILDAKAPSEAAVAAGRVWGVVLLVRQGLVARPAAMGWIGGGLTEARRDARRLGVEAFPAVAHATLARALNGAGGDSPLSKRLRMLWAVSTGRL
ncbi:MAG TPA: squalene/phytoene synthase family protein [Caulobacteraceae bacterium]|nr:squalene/phytoene synthase family protein [Caulobacteraceae bacterium]